MEPIASFGPIDRAPASTATYAIIANQSPR
jgi:hypothetical protein